jgi:transcriptional regulator with XRE-family HTH domain
MAMEIHEIFRKAREFQGITQNDVLEMICPLELAAPSLSTFESGKSSISKIKLSRIAEVLNLNPKLVDEETINPFQSKNVIKMFLKEGNLLKSNIEPLFFVARFNRHIRLISLVAPPDVQRKLYRMLGLRWVFALIFCDDVNNVYLLRGKKDLVNIIVDLPYFVNKILSVSQESNCNFSMAQLQATEDLFKKIREDTLSRANVERLFKDAKFEEVHPRRTDSESKEISLTDEEKKEINFQRSLGMRTPSELDLIVVKALHEGNVPHNVLLSLIMVIKEEKINEEELLNRIRYRR